MHDDFVVLGHFLAKIVSRQETRTELKWNPQGKRNRGRPKATWRRSTEQELTPRENPGANLQNWQEIEGSGERLYVTYAPHGVKGLID